MVRERVPTDTEKAYKTALDTSQREWEKSKPGLCICSGIITIMCIVTIVLIIHYTRKERKLWKLENPA